MWIVSDGGCHTLILSGSEGSGQRLRNFSHSLLRSFTPLRFVQDDDNRDLPGVADRRCFTPVAACGFYSFDLSASFFRGVVQR